MALHQLNNAGWSFKTLLKNHIQKLRQLAGSELLGFDLKTKKILLRTERPVTISLSFVWNEPLSASLGSKVNNWWTQEKRKKESFSKRTSHFEAACCQVMACCSSVTDLNSDREKGLGGEKGFKKWMSSEFFHRHLLLALVSTQGQSVIWICTLPLQLTQPEWMECTVPWLTFSTCTY